MQKNDLSADILIHQLLIGVLWQSTDEHGNVFLNEPDRNLISEINSAAHSFSLGYGLAHIFVVPERASRWMRDAYLRQFLTRLPGAAPWHKALAGKSLIDVFVSTHLNEWLSHISKFGRRPAPLLLNEWINKAVKDFQGEAMTERRTKTEWTSDYGNLLLLKASALGIALPQSARSLYSILLSPISSFAQHAESQRFTAW